MDKISISSNITSKDAIRIIHVLPNWLKTFDKNIREILLVYDKKPIEGRISKLHKTSNYILPLDLNKISQMDSRIRIVELNYGEAKEILSKWFIKKEFPIRCQAGTPIYAFIYAIEKSKSDIVFKVDCDMLFHDKGFIAQCNKECSLDDYDIIEISRTGLNSLEFSTRAFYVNKRVLYKKLPLPAYKLDLLKYLHRKINNRPVYLALEQMIQKEINMNKIKRKVISPDLGLCMHVPFIENFNLNNIEEVIQNFTNGSIPEKQLLYSENFNPEFWA